MSPEDAFRRVLAARLPAGPGWTAWIDGTVTELAASIEGAVLAPSDVVTVLKWHDHGTLGTPDEDALATRLEAS